MESSLRAGLLRRVTCSLLIAPRLSNSFSVIAERADVRARVMALRCLAILYNTKYFNTQ